MSKRTEFQDKFSERPFAVGSVRAYRLFYIDEKAHDLYGQWGTHWEPGENVATCRSSTWIGSVLTGRCDGTNLMDCTCGFYAYWSSLHVLNTMRTLFASSSAARNVVLSVTEHYGETLMGSLGVRSRKAKILAIGMLTDKQVDVTPNLVRFSMDGDTIEPFKVPDLPQKSEMMLSDALAERYPDAKIFIGAHGVYDMIMEYGSYDPNADEEFDDHADMPAFWPSSAWELTKKMPLTEGTAESWRNFILQIDSGRFSFPGDFYVTRSSWVWGKTYAPSWTVSALPPVPLPSTPARDSKSGMTEAERAALRKVIEDKAKRNPPPHKPQGIDWRQG